MSTIRVYSLINKRALVTRDSARTIHNALAAAIREDPGELVIDFSGVQAVTPSFIDELLSVCEEVSGSANRPGLHIRFQNIPTRLSAKFSAIGRARQLDITELSDRAWVIFYPLARQLT